MPLITPRPSRAILKAFRDGLARLIELGRAPASLPQEGYPLRVYNLSLNDIVKYEGVREARSVLWDFLVKRSRVGAVLISVAKSPDGRPQVTSIARNPIAPETARAVDRIARLPVASRKRYELRLLRIPALSLRAFWLKSLQKEERDVAVPWQTIHNDFRIMRPYPMEEFLSVLRPVVETYLKAQRQALRRARKRL